MAKSLIEQAQEQANIAKASMEQMQQVKEAVEERTQAVNDLQEQQKKTQDIFNQLIKNENAFNEKIITFYNQLAKYDTQLKNCFEGNINKMQDITSDVKKELKANIREELQTNINAINNITNYFNDNTKELTQNLQNDFNNYKSELEKTIQQAQATITKKSLGLCSELAVALVISVIAIFIVLFYCLNWQFNFIDTTLPQNEILRQVLGTVVRMVLGIALFCIIGAILGAKRD